VPNAGEGIIGTSLDYYFSGTPSTQKDMGSFWCTFHDIGMKKNLSTTFYQIGAYFGGVDEILWFIGEIGMPHQLA
jgi:hypothetical protein